MARLGLLLKPETEPKLCTRSSIGNDLRSPEPIDPTADKPHKFPRKPPPGTYCRHILFCPVMHTGFSRLRGASLSPAAPIRGDGVRGKLIQIFGRKSFFFRKPVGKVALSARKE